MPVVNNPSAHIRNAIYNVYGHWSRSVKTRDGYKLIAYNVNGELHTQLFNLKTDPWEMHNLADKKRFRKKVKALRQLLKKEMWDAYDDLDIDLPDWGRKAWQKGAGS